MPSTCLYFRGKKNRLLYYEKIFTDRVGDTVHDVKAKRTEGAICELHIKLLCDQCHYSDFKIVEVKNLKVICDTTGAYSDCADITIRVEDGECTSCRRIEALNCHLPCDLEDCPKHYNSDDFAWDHLLGGWFDPAKEGFERVEETVWQKTSGEHSIRFSTRIPGVAKYLNSESDSE